MTTSPAKDATNGIAKNDDTSTEQLRIDDDFRDGKEFSHDVALMATAWLASFEQRFMPCLVADARAAAAAAATATAKATTIEEVGAGVFSGSRCGSGGPEIKDGMFLPAAISRVLHEVRKRHNSITCSLGAWRFEFDSSFTKSWLSDDVFADDVVLRSLRILKPIPVVLRSLHLVLL